MRTDRGRDDHSVHFAGRDELGDVGERGDVRRDGTAPLGLQVDDRRKLHAVGA